MMKRVLCLLVALVGCTRPNPDYCAADSDCADPARPFCDINGEYDESSHTAHTCSVEPANCPAERCGCEPAEARCEGDNLITCNSDGRSETTTACAMGCSDADQRCFTFEPSNGLGPALAMASAQADVQLSQGAKIDTATGMVTTSGGAPIAVKTLMVTQGSTPIRVFVAKSFTLEATTITGDRAVAFVAEGPISVLGKVDAAARGGTSGPGLATLPCEAPQITAPASYVPGGGGAGNATSGGNGGADHMAGGPGGTALSSFVPLVGGCRGGFVVDGMGIALGAGGGGGGAIQLVSASLIQLSAQGIVHVGGGGGSAGQGNGGGGSGGTVVLEAPHVKIDGSSAGVAANGGGGAACGLSGADGSPDANAAPAGQGGGNCLTITCGGNGGTAISPAVSACICNLANCGSGIRYGGGGGAAGRLRIATRDGIVETVGSPIVSAMQTTAKLDPK